MNGLNNNSHSSHCRLCKQRVGEMLEAIYGRCQQNYSFGWSASPRDYVTTPIGPTLERIRAGLENFRGYRDFIKSPIVPPCDYYVSTPPFILEFDENQHFSRPRLIALSLYPEDVQLGFSVTDWRDLCRGLDVRDDEPFDRDERRAWYDTLRDLVPIVYGFAPTARVYGGAYPWCSLNPSSIRDREHFLGWISSQSAENP
ncbi:MAG TPA: hypothetical protein VGH22_21970 [Candidatus Binatia bacterium]